MSEQNVKPNKFNVLNEVKDDFLNEIRLLYVFKDDENNNNVLILKNDHMNDDDKLSRRMNVYAFGSNRNGVLGFEHENNVKEPTIIEELNAKEICDFKNSSHHVIARSLDGKIYCWGSNYKGRLGNGSEDKNLYKPKLNEYLKAEEIIDVCCGEDHSLALTSDGDVYSWGWNVFGQVGSAEGGNNHCEPIPIKVLSSNDDKIIIISCGLRHSAALTTNRYLYCWGDNRSGQLGIGPQYFSFKPTVIKFDQTICIEAISCGSKYSLLISSDENIHVFGENKCGQLGIGEGENVSRPKKLNYSKKFTQIATHFQNNISVAISKENIFYSWGKCGEEIIREPREANYVCAEDIFQTVLGITVKTIKYQYYVNQNFISNGRYKRDWLEKSEIGHGSYGKTFEVEDIAQTKFAIKKIPIKEDNNSIKELLNSPFIFNLKNENLVKYYDVWYENDFDLKMCFREYTEENTIYIQMELCHKVLKEVQKEISDNFKLKSSKELNILGYFITSEIFIEILEGVSYLHSKNFIHRDLSPQNILLKRGNIKEFVRIADFGLLKFIGGCDSHTSDVGNLSYQAPEVGSDNGYNASADIFSLGKILKELFEMNSDDSYEKISILEPKYLSLKRLSDDMTKEDPKRRPNCKEILEKKKSWTFSRNEIEVDKYLEFISELNCELFVSSIIISKLKNLRNV